MVDTELPCDPTGDFSIDVNDVLLLNQFGACAGCEADLDGDGDVDVNDLLDLIGMWGPC